MKRFSVFIVIAGLFCLFCSAASPAWAKNPAGRVFYGNIYGTIQAAASGSPISGAQVYITEAVVKRASRNHQNAVQSNIGCVILPDPDRAVRSGLSKSDGTYLVNNIPIHGNVQRYTVFIRSENAAPVVVDQVPILPGAAMALQIDVNATDTDTAHVVSGLEVSQTVLTNNYRHKLRAVVPPPPMPPADERLTGVRPDEAYTLTIYATREGLVYKRIRRQDDKKAFTLVSDNTLYPPYELPYEEIDEMWQYYAHLSFSDGKETLEALMDERIEDIRKKVYEISDQLEGN